MTLCKIYEDRIQDNEYGRQVERGRYLDHQDTGKGVPSGRGEG